MIDGAFILEGLLTAFLVAQFGLIVWNRREMRRPEIRDWGDSSPLVSLLVPARDEEDVIGRCL